MLETVVVTGIVALIAGAAGTLFLAGATPAVASANRDVVAVFDEGRRTAEAFDAATVVFAPAISGSGYTARVYTRTPGEAAFQPRNGPAFESTVAIAETAAPLGAPGFAFTIDSHGNVAALADYAVNGSDYVKRACPSSGAYTLELTYAHDTRSVTVPCTLGVSSTAALTLEMPPAASSSAPLAAATCPGTETCTLANLAGPPAASCPAGLTADPTIAGRCDAPVSTPTAPATVSTCPPGSTGTPPNCISPIIQPTPTAAPTSGAMCQPNAPDSNGFSTCSSRALTMTGHAITTESCGTHTPVIDPGPQFETIVDVFQNNIFWGSYRITISTLRVPWINQRTGVADCGLLYTLAFGVEAISPIGGNAATTPSNDTGDPQIIDEGVESIIVAPLGASWGSNS